ncbi:nucleotidyltransferase domain-containing protein [candidate division KSB1 bacterium]|nr:nucleotidyltransferase domain-containing protein [candidate division KSB1 bacterium]NIR71845.1 nucleotidyltransferase domain-containing protein [candidate division KSB1 bacterium]NIS25361.1 nucleotidyltransferase domain-containing protein [candidate division KSB1 bacterium]NIT71831.1 nucleotidyltransferase domain-containing protein [candidate division KSB1 bacterium]NIU25569.1 nucleotidyltransferase domain-containing protein [candidate division KSB1 bacterium]
MSQAISTEIKSLKRHVKAFAEEVKEVLVVYLHGSVVEGFAREDSDLDLAVVISDANKKNLMRLQLRYTEFFDLRFKDREIDLKIINQAPLAVKFSVLQKGEIVFSRDEELRTAFEVDVIKRFLDFRHYYDAYNKEFIDRLAEEGVF